MPKVKALGYIGCDVSRLGAWDEFLGSLLSLQSSSDSTDQVRHFTATDHRRQLTLRKSDHDSLAYVGWEIETQEDLREFERELTAGGIAFVHGDAALCDERAVTDLLVLPGPDGVRTELFFGPKRRREPSNLGNSASRRVASNLTLAHIVLASGNRSASVDWYLKVLGFSVSDHIFWDGVEASFLRCNPHHHSIALMNPVGDMRGGDLGHFMVEADSLDDVGYAYDAVKKNGIPIAFTFGRHSNDRAISFYVYTPSGWLMEYGYGGRIVDDPAWEPKLYSAPSIWGHEPQPPPDGDQSKKRY